MPMESVYFEATMGSCKEFIESRSKPSSEVTVVISPLKVTQMGETIKVSFGCNMYKACENPKCQYGHVSYDRAASQKKS